MALTPNVSIGVRVTNLTEIRDGGEDLSADELEVGMTLRMEGVFVEGGIAALEIEVTNSAVELELRGQISAIDEMNRRIAVRGLMIQVPEAAEIKGPGDNLLQFDDLDLSQFIGVEGNLSEGQVIASRVRVRMDGEELARVSLEGIVASIDPLTIFVSIEGIPSSPVAVEIGEDTKIHGVLVVGALVRVIGTLTPELTVRGDKILVKRLLQLAPDKLKMRPEQTRRVEVILRNPLDEDVALSIQSEDTSVAEPLVSMLLIPAGRQTGFFEVIAKDIEEGETRITVQMPVELGGLIVELDVEVQRRRQEEPDEEDEEVELKWVPRQLNLAPGDIRVAQLSLNQQAAAGLMAELKFKKGGADIASFLPVVVNFDEGARSAEVEIQAISSGEAKIRAHLVRDGGVLQESDDLKVEVRIAQGQELAIFWDEDELELAPNETALVKLRLEPAAPFDLRAILTPGDARRFVKFPAQVSFAAGVDEAEVEIKAKNQDGKAKIRAGLPAAVGGDSDSLEVEVGED